MAADKVGIRTRARAFQESMDPSRSVPGALFGEVCNSRGDPINHLLLCIEPMLAVNVVSTVTSWRGRLFMDPARLCCIPGALGLLSEEEFKINAFCCQ